MKYKFLILLSIMLTNFSSPQVRWLNPQPVSGSIYSVFFVDSLYGWIAGDGTILKTTNGGESWFEQSVPLATTLRRIYFSDKNNGVIIGGDISTPYLGSVLVTTDGGNSWIDKDPLPYPSEDRGFNDMHFVNTHIGYIAGFTGVYKTEDMGQTWTALGGSGWATAIYFIDSLTGFLGNTVGALLKTTNGGNSWEEIANIHWTWFKDIKFLDSHIGWMVGVGLYSDYAIIKKTTDGGFTWAVQDSQVNAEYNEVEIFDSLNTMVVGSQGRVLYTTDGGNLWLSSATNDDGDYYELTTQGSHLWVSGVKDYYFPKLFVSTDFGDHWTQKSSTFTENNLNDISFSDSLKGWLVGNGGTIAKTSDGGENWEQESLFSIDITSVSTPTNQDIYLSGNGGEFISSHNGGNNWSVSYIGPYLTRTKIIFFSKYLGYCFAPYEGEIYKTTDAGNNWFLQSEGYYFSQMFFADSLNGWAVLPPLETGDYLLFHTIDGGDTWEESSGFSLIGSIYFLNSHTGFLSDYNSIYRTTDSGLTWEFFSQMGELEIKQMWFIDESQGYVVAERYEYMRGIFFTKDNGSSWQTVRNYIFINEIYSFQKSRLWGVGEYGNLFSVNTEILTDIEEPFGNDLEPDNFFLSQNYPNPFNPETKINYFLPVPGFVTIKVFDVLGREVSTLVNEVKSSGNYSVNFSGSNLASGIYIYRLISGNYVSVKKMILLK